MEVTIRSGISVAGHLVHATLTLFSCGVWGLVWFAHWLATRQVKRIEAGAVYGFDYGHPELSPQYRLFNGRYETWDAAAGTWVPCGGGRG